MNHKPTPGMVKIHKAILSAIPEGKNHVIHVVYGDEGVYDHIWQVKMPPVECIIMLEQMIAQMKSKRAKLIRELIE